MLSFSTSRLAAVTCFMAGTVLWCMTPAALAQDSETDLLAAPLSVVPRSAITPAAIPPAAISPTASDIESVTLFDTPTQQTAFERQQLLQAEDSAPAELTEPLQSEMTQADQRVMEELISIAVRNAPAVRDAHAAMGVAPFLDAFVVEIAPSRISSTLSDASVLAEPYQYSDNSTTSTFTFNPVQLINGIQQIPALRSHLRDAEQQTRVAVIQGYVAYVQARQSTAISTRQLNTVVASIQEQSQVASIQLNQIPASSVLVNDESYIAAATESLAANSDEMVALETLAATVGMPTQDMLSVIATTIQAAEDQPNAVVEAKPPVEEVRFLWKAAPSPSVLLVDRERG